ncbi:MAG: 3-deoxy-D-manno-octulosonate cytidylyltransferase [Elusimicrobia bacterium GWC2_51_8]|nr:MAG: 3-deoxy-D-manno-octulosonate cytidylyltransferase [Elusimicrobia bacterium GWA2_51_34]OGR62670.1 MAG: 3-deoxy-D-manno-octulosonate cytidylyltransferase [Elusimicrobia bacterium GWC2_51_8]OGR88176.1 MAG: 3-deoxy-D-manno-octulosonate cytidylyltransferase [Elusimicrobia bacterium GWF2_52_66]HAF95380.1 3-deoxy-manno-octulosonate cytidylyltransferase [Elusimicrobiota bacterium]HCE98756.1 3-deoxy-manno-octulosonate cytidylyltransferase [Elusimicrobiota bacterium]
MSQALIIIPARYNSQRFPGKVLAKIAGKPVLQWCYEAAVRSGLGEVVIATEDRRVMAFAASIGAAVVLTSPRCQSGTDRVFEAARKTRKEFVINFQGDEPFLRSQTLVKAFRQLVKARDCDIGTACARIKETSDIRNSNCVKIAMNSKGRALYFSRSSIPFHHPLSELKNRPFYKHCGFYIYRREALARFVKLTASPLEKLERLEQLRALENGMGITVAEVRELGPAIDTPADIKAAEKFLRKRLQR